MSMITKKGFKESIAVIIAVIAVLSAFAPAEAFAATKYPARVKGVKASYKKGRMTVSWKKAKRAVKYRVYIKAAGSDWTVCKKSVKGRKLIYKSKIREKYSFRVKAIGKNDKLSKKYSKAVTVMNKVSSSAKSISCATSPENKTEMFQTFPGQSREVRMKGAYSGKAKWTFDKKYLKANTKGESIKEFTALKTGETTITVTDSRGLHKVKIRVEIDKISCDKDQDEPIYDYIKENPNEFFNTYEELRAVPLEKMLDTTEAENNNYELAMRYKTIAEEVTSGKTKYKDKIAALAAWKKANGFTYDHRASGSDASILDTKAGNQYQTSQAFALLLRYADIPAVVGSAPEGLESEVFAYNYDQEDERLRWLCYEGKESIAGYGDLAQNKINFGGFNFRAEHGFYMTTSLIAK